MGVTGLWRLLEPAGKPVPLETLENKVLAVDISIWLHQMVKGFQDARGGAVVNAHLLGLFQRLCKLLYYKIKPIFVFDGGVPLLKMQTIDKRQRSKKQIRNTVDNVRQQILQIITKQMAVNKVILEKNKSPKNRSPVKSIAHNAANDEDLFKLPPLTEEAATAKDSEESDSEELSESCHRHNIDLHSLDVNSDYFKNLTPKERHDLLTDLKETRKQSSWGRLHELPSQSDNFSSYQMDRLLKRRQFQKSLEETEKEMGGHYLSLNELEILLNEEGIDTKIAKLPTRQIASDENTRFLLVKDVKQALETAAKKESQQNLIPISSTKEEQATIRSSDLGTEYDADLDAAIKMSLECLNDTEKENVSTIKDSGNIIDLTFLGPDFLESDSDWLTDDESENDEPNIVNQNLALAKAYMLENSGLSKHEISRIIGDKTSKTKKVKKSKSFKTFSPTNNSENVTGVFSKKESENALSNLKDDNTIECKEGRNISVLENEASKNTVDIDESKKMSPLKSSNPKEITEVPNISVISDSSTDSEEFEEVSQDSVNVKKSESIEVTLKTDPIEDDDIFADVFDVNKTDSQAVKIGNKDCGTSASGSNIISQSIIVNKMFEINDSPNLDSKFDMKESKISNKSSSNNHTIDQRKIIPEVKIIEDDSVLLSGKKKSDSTGTLVINDIEVEKDIQTEANSDENVNTVEIHTPEKSIPIALKISQNENNIAPKDTLPNDDNLTDISQNEKEQSPKKGMTLNEIRHMISSEDTSAASSKDGAIENQKISTEELSVFSDNLGIERDRLEKQQNKLDRMGRNISEEMTRDAQELLKIFGIPFIVAPMEAEAQCAFLESIHLTDGTITDDSDIWLFGGRSVYKNFFNNQKYVLQFLSENIQSCFKLTREQLILLALLVGSDYTTGVQGVGPVTALEILATFPNTKLEVNPPYVSLLEGLRKFRSWWSDKRTYGHGKLRNKLRNISLGQDFPSFRVVEAYLAPKVDSNNESFSWGNPDVTAIREYTKQKFGWSQNKTDEILKPVLKRLTEKISQQSIRSFFRTEVNSTVAGENMSKRVKKAVDRMGGGIVDSDEDRETSKAKRPRKTKEPKRKKSDSSDSVSKSEEIPNSSVKIKSQIGACSEAETSQNIGAEPFVIPERYQEKIPQRENEKSIMLKNKLKAIELFRTSKKGPGFIKKRKKDMRKLKKEAELSESSSD